MFETCETLMIWRFQHARTGENVARLIGGGEGKEGGREGRLILPSGAGNMALVVVVVVVVLLVMVVVVVTVVIVVEGMILVVEGVVKVLVW